jgi:MoaA/NifB/PqqE/SkfB family radical SAM enzyme
MYEYDEIKIIHLEITNRCNSKCILCSRYLKNGNLNPNINKDDLLIDDIKKIFNDINFIKQLNSIILCGNFGDPLCNKDLIKIIKYFKSINKDISIDISTNGSIRSKEYWKELALYKPIVRFCIDGLKDTNHLYRQNTSYDKIIENATTFIKHGGHAIWNFIGFEHNEHQVEEIKKLYVEIGFKSLNIKKSNRLNRLNLNKPGSFKNLKNPRQVKYNSSSENFNTQNELDKYLDETEIECVFGKANNMYISAKGDVVPCCWLGVTLDYGDHTKEDLKLVNNFFKNKNDNNVFHHSIKEILEGNIFKKIKDSWKIKKIKNGKIKTCSYFCGSKKYGEECFKC